MPTVKFINEKKTIEVPAGANRRKEARKAGINVYSGIGRVLHCPGLGMCTTCKVIIRKGIENLSPQSKWEKMNMLKDPLTFFARIGHEHEMRLACQAQVNGDIEVETHPPFNWHGERYWG